MKKTRYDKLITVLAYVIAFLIGCYYTYKIVPEMVVKRGGLYFGGEFLLPMLFPLIVHILNSVFDFFAEKK